MSECGRWRERAFSARGICNRRPQPSPLLPGGPSGLPVSGPRPPRPISAPRSARPWTPPLPGSASASGARSRRPLRLLPASARGGAGFRGCAPPRGWAGSSSRGPGPASRGWGDRPRGFLSHSRLCRRVCARMFLNLGGPGSSPAWTEGFRGVPEMAERVLRSGTD